MSGFFSLDGPFARFGNMLADILVLSLLWIFFSIPLFTSGAATTALFYVSTRRISHRERYMFRDFWKSFCKNFKQATACWLLILLVATVLFINITNIEVLGPIGHFLLPVKLCIALEVYIISLYVFPLIARFEMSFIEIFKTAFFMANRHLLTTLGLIFIGVGVFLISALTMIFLLMAMGTYVFLASHLIMRVFKKYRPEIDCDEV